jgi:hypothetical protein
MPKQHTNNGEPAGGDTQPLESRSPDDESADVPPLDRNPPPGKLPSDADVQAERQP